MSDNIFTRKRILYEDNHILVVNKQCGELVQPDKDSSSSLEDTVKDFIKKRDAKPSGVFLGVVHRIDRPVSGAVLFAKTSKALTRLNEMIKNRQIEKHYWAIVEQLPENESGELVHFILRDQKTNRSKALESPRSDAKEAKLSYRHIASGKKYHLLDINLLTGRHHQIRAQLSKIGCPIKGDLKYGAARSNPDGGICLHSRSLSFTHPVSKERVTVIAPAPAGDNLWDFFEQAAR